MGGLVPGFEYEIVIVDFLGVVRSMVDDIVLHYSLFRVGAKEILRNCPAGTFSKVVVAWNVANMRGLCRLGCGHANEEGAELNFTFQSQFFCLNQLTQHASKQIAPTIKIQ